MKQRADSVESIGDGVIAADRIAGAHAALSEAEERFETLRRTIGLFAGPTALALVWILPLPALSMAEHRLAAIVALVVFWWITEALPIPITALIGTSLAVLAGVASATDAFAPFANPTIFLFVGSFIIGRAIATHGLDRRLATALLSVPAVGSSLVRTRTAVGVLTFAISAWMSNTATTAMMVPIALGVLSARAGEAAHQAGAFRTGLLLIVAFSSAIGGMVTPVGSPPNLITIGLLERTTGIRINFLTWMMVATPIAAAGAGVLFLAAQWKFPLPPGAMVANREVPAHRRDWTVGQRNCAIAFFTAVFLWIFPGVLALVAPNASLLMFLTSRLDEAVVAVVAASLLFVLPVDWSRRRFTLGWDEAARIDWGTILLFGGGLSLGRLMFETGLADHIGRGMIALSGADSLWSVTAMATVLGVVLSELTSNTAAASMLVPVIISICEVAGLNPTTPCLGAAFGASFGFMLPVSTPPNAIVYGTGLVPIRSMIKLGIVMDVAGIAVILAGLRLLCPLLGLM